MEKRALRLQFVKEEQTNPTLEKPSRKLTERQRKLNRAQKKISKRKYFASNSPLIYFFAKFRSSTNIPLKK